jgi:hypothetical protein
MSDPIQETFAELRHRLIHGRVLADIWDYFLVNVYKNGEMRQLGKPSTHHPTLIEVLRAVVGRMAADEIAITDLIFYRIEDEKFVHGPFSVGHYVCGMFYFEDLNKGLVALTPLLRGEMKVARFTGIPLPPPPDPRRN